MSEDASSDSHVLSPQAVVSSQSDDEDMNFDEVETELNASVERALDDIQQFRNTVVRSKLW